MFKLKVSQTVPLMIMLSALLTGVSVGFISYYQATQTLVHDVELKMTSLIEARKHELKAYLGSIQEDLNIMSSNVGVTYAMTDFSTAWNQIGDNPVQKLQKLYIQDNPHPTGQKENLDAAGDGSRYSAVHKKHHPWFRHFLRSRDYYDIFLTNKNGDLVYSVFKELDYATNMNTGQWRDSDLANAFRAAINNPNEMHFFDFRPYGPSNNAPASFMSKAIKNAAGEVLGVLTFQMPIERLNENMAPLKGMGETAESFVVGEDKLMRTNSRFSEESTILKTSVSNSAVEKAFAGETGMTTTENYLGVPVFSAYTPFEFMGTKWAILTEETAEEVMAPLSVIRNFTILFTLISITIVTGLGIFGGNRITKPLNQLIRLMGKLETGDTGFEVPHAQRGDEIGDMARALKSFKQTAIQNNQMAKEREEQERAEQERLNQERQRIMNELADSFESTVSDAIKKVFETSSSLNKSSDKMGSATMNANQKSLQVASTSGETSSNVQTVAGATEEMTASIREIAKQVSKSKQVIDDAVQRAEAADSSAQVLSNAVDSIGEVTELINDITDKINMLALNATIESARAGEAGKGFAVVANEVKDLANQTSLATKDISKEITNIQHISTEVVNVMQAIREAISNINEYASSIATAVEEQSAVTNEISMNMLSAADGVQLISANIEDVTKASEAADTAANEVLNASQMLNEQAQFLDEESRNFIQGIRNAS